MPQRSDAEIEAVLTAYHGADGWDEQDRVDMSYALAAADAVAPSTARIEALEAAGNRLAEAVESESTTKVIASALAAWRAVEKGDRDE